MYREIDRIVWDETHGHMDVTYAGGETVLVVANRAVAVSLAEDAGLVSAPAPPGMVRWIRSPDIASIWSASKAKSGSRRLSSRAAT